MNYPLWMEILIALLSVFGVYAIVRVVTGALFSAGNLRTAICIRAPEDAFMLDALLREAEDTFFLRGNRKIIVLFRRGVIDGTVGTGDIPNPATVALLAKYGAEYVIVDD